MKQSRNHCILYIAWAVVRYLKPFPHRWQRWRNTKFSTKHVKIQAVLYSIWYRAALLSEDPPLPTSCTGTRQTHVAITNHLFPGVVFRLIQLTEWLCVHQHRQKAGEGGACKGWVSEAERKRKAGLLIWDSVDHGPLNVFECLVISFILCINLVLISSKLNEWDKGFAVWSFDKFCESS